jgi:hypothetical protein
MIYSRWNRITDVLQYLKKRKIKYEERSQLISWKYSASSQYTRIRGSKHTGGGEVRCPSSLKKHDLTHFKKESLSQDKK